MSALPRLHVVTDDGVLARQDAPARAREVLEAGGAAVALHLRGPSTSGRRLHELTTALGPVAEATGSLLVVNDRIDVALAAGITAVQLGRRSLPADVARPISGRARLGVSCHDADEVAAAVACGASWILLGHVFATASHPKRPPLGIERARALIETAGAVPTLAIGGLTPGRVPDVVAAGAWGVAVVSGIWGVGSPRAATSEYISVLQAHAGGT